MSLVSGSAGGVAALDRDVPVDGFKTMEQMIAESPSTFLRSYPRVPDRHIRRGSDDACGDRHLWRGRLFREPPDARDRNPMALGAQPDMLRLVVVKEGASSLASASGCGGAGPDSADDEPALRLGPTDSITFAPYRCCWQEWLWGPVLCLRGVQRKSIRWSRSNTNEHDFRD